MLRALYSFQTNMLFHRSFTNLFQIDRRRPLLYAHFVARILKKTMYSWCNLRYEHGGSMPVMWKRQENANG